MLFLFLAFIFQLHILGALLCFAHFCWRNLDLLIRFDSALDSAKDLITDPYLRFAPELHGPPDLASFEKFLDLTHEPHWKCNHRPMRRGCRAP